MPGLRRCVVCAGCAEPNKSLVPRLSPSLGKMDLNWEDGTMRRTIKLFVAGGVVAACLAGAASASASSLVCNSGCFFTSIQAAINAAQPGATITVGAGSYYENVVVNKSVTLRGAGTTSVIYPATSMPICAGGSLCGGSASNII